MLAIPTSIDPAIRPFARHLIIAVAGVTFVVATAARLKAHRPVGFDDAVAVLSSADATVGRQLFAASCTSCHGPAGEGMPQQGVPLRGSTFVGRASDQAILNLLRMGRPANDRASLT